MELPKNFVPLPWDAAEVGRAVWICETKAGAPHAYGPYMVADKDNRMLDDPEDIKAQPFQHQTDNLIVPLSFKDAIVGFKDAMYHYFASRVLAEQDDASPDEQYDYVNADAAVDQAIERLITLIRGRS